MRRITTSITTILYSTPASPTSPSLQSSCATSAVSALPKRKRSSRSRSVSPADAAGCSGAPTSTDQETTGKRHRPTDFTTPAFRSFSIRERFLQNRQNSRLSRVSENQDHGPHRQLLAKHPDRRDFSFSGKTATTGHPLTFSKTVHLAHFSVFEENWGSAQVARFQQIRHPVDFAKIGSSPHFSAFGENRDFALTSRFSETSLTGHFFQNWHHFHFSRKTAILRRPRFQKTHHRTPFSKIDTPAYPGGFHPCPRPPP